MRYGLWITAVAALAFWMAPTAAQQTKTLRAEVFGEEFEYDWRADTMVFSGSCRLVVHGPDQAEITAPRITVQLTKEQTQVKLAKTTGQTNLTLLTAPDTNGLRRRITAVAKGGATYSEQTQVVELSGGATVDMTMAPPAAGAQSANLTGEQITINLQTTTIKVTRAHVEISGER